MTQIESGQAFEVPGAGGELIRGNIHLPTCQSDGPWPLLLVCHGFKGYKDYGFFPHLTRRLAEAGVAAVRFNFSHDGIDDDPATFGRPDLFEKDSWSNQLADVQAVIGAAAGGAGKLPLAGQIDATRVGLVGHSRGGIVALLTAAEDPRVKAVATLAAPASADNLTDRQKREIREKGFVVSPSSRTGQPLRIGRAWLDDFERSENAARFDLPAAVGRIAAPLLIAHGSADVSVPVASADQIAGAYRGVAERLVLDGANHTFNCANPFTGPSPALEQLLVVLSAFLRDHLVGQ